MGRKGKKKAAENESEVEMEVKHTNTQWFPSTLRHPTGRLRISLISHLFGIALGLGLGLLLFAWQSEVVWAALLGIYLVSLALLHQVEFVVITSLDASQDASDESFIMCHDVDYTISLLAPWLEYFARLAVFPDWRMYYSWVLIGACLMVMGHVTRFMAIVALGEDFASSSEPEKKSPPPLCTSGIYRQLRHPALFGFFWWGFGSQLLLHNPLCLVAFCIFYGYHVRQQIRNEEAILTDRYGEKYLQYRKSTRTGLPFIS